MTTVRAAEKIHLSASGLLANLRTVFNGIKESKGDPRGRKTKITLTDCLMSGMAIFGLKFSSLLQFAERRDKETTVHNLRSLYGVQTAPCDTQMRDRLDNVDPSAIRPAFKNMFAALQRGKILERYVFLGKYYLVAQDGTGVFSSEKIHCENCCEKHHQDGRTTYYHQMLAGVVVHPDHREVFPFCPEPITKQDGATKNDCERNASFRFLEHLRREHPHLKLIITSDNLSANAPYIRKLQALKMSYLIVAKPEGNKSLFEWLKGIQLAEHVVKLKDESVYHFRFINGVPINDANHELEVNYFEVDIQEANGTKRHFSWVTDVKVTKDNVSELTRGGRSKWKIENETFNTLKNQGYNFEHNFGHGYKHLCTVFSLLMFLSFLVDQIQQRCCGLFQAALKNTKTRISLWDQFRSLWFGYTIHSWEDLWLSIAHGFKPATLAPDSS